jgi:hypothetical protein
MLPALACHQVSRYLIVERFPAQNDNLRCCLAELLSPNRLRKEHDIRTGIPVLLSTEKPRCKLVASEEMMAADNLLDYQVRGGRRGSGWRHHSAQLARWRADACTLPRNYS